MSFEHPAFLWLALLMLPELFLIRLRGPGLASCLAALSGPRRRKKALLRYALLSTAGGAAGLGFILCVALALAMPSWGRRGAVSERSGLEAVILLDVSRSMELGDVAPTRLAAAKALSRNLVRDLSGSLGSAALVAVKGDGLILVPMTEDSEAINAALDYAGPDLMTAAGSDLAAGLRAAARAFPESGMGNRLVLLMSDGASPERDESALREARNLAKDGARLLVAGFGGSAPLTVNAPGGLVTDKRGRPVTSALRPGFLRDLAAAAGGRYLDGADAATPAALAAEFAKAGRPGVRLEYSGVDRSPLFAALALGFLLCAALAALAASSGGGR